VVVLSVLDAWIFPLVGYDQDIGIFVQARLLRLLRVIKITKVVPELSIVVEGLLKSMISLFWVFVLLWLFLYAAAICCVEVMGHDDSGFPAFSESQSTIDDEFVTNFNNYVFFGTVYRAMITLFGVILLSDWHLVRPIMEVHPFMVPFLIFLVCLLAFGVLNVIIGIVVDNTLQTMQEYKAKAIEAEHRAMNMAAEHVADLVFQIDTDGDGRVTSDELEASLQNESMRKYLATMDLPHNFQPSEFVQMLDADGSGALCKDEFKEGVYRLIFCNDFQRQCLNQAALGAIHKSVNEIRKDIRKIIKKEMGGAIKEIIREVQDTIGTGKQESTFTGSENTLTATCESVKSEDRSGLEQVPPVPIPRLAALSSDLRAYGSLQTPMSLQSSPRDADYKVTIPAKPIQASWQPLRIAPMVNVRQNEAIQNSFPNPPSETSRFYNLQDLRVGPEVSFRQAAMESRWRAYPPYLPSPAETPRLSPMLSPGPSPRQVNVSRAYFEAGRFEV
jgi:voltage-gated sodium channel